MILGEKKGQKVFLFQLNHHISIQWFIS